MKVLIIEDEKAMAAEMLAYLEKAYCCDLAYTARQGLEKMDENQYDFILLDLGLPDKDGLLLLQEARKNCPEASYIILTARGQLEDRIRGLQMGADDYLPKPFSLPELQARMQAISRRKFGLTDSKIALGDFDIDLHQRSVFFENQEISLSRREFDLLSYMLLHKNRPLTRMQLSEHIWGNFSDDDYDSNYIDVHIKNIRKKLSAFASVEWLQTLRHVGYKIKL
ncbi:MULTISPECIES: response regulator transcription factor [Chitinophaga]|uniref:response regulator transcription factor n=1 Tax=Chitinophaga TaxID=79328 RepID=UPI000DBAC543|nr:response regulator transcription factor [Chitinophaga ginsengisegetis]MDR6566721.1 DNA-binding response OmpR family regulator [Chitinophaga ginsengisegetis]MDR6646451.1 DNA-binding response OmpR family regulator [Chitinophaga ginsengisegetis]MDR6652801.1 DNA-binding response OmpR family regulator [Chitinophaga ginsengisegetis]